MSERSELASQIAIRIDGVPVARAVLVHLVDVTVEQHAHLPGMFTIRLDDPGLNLLDKGPFTLASQVTISAETEGKAKIELIRGEITALEPEFRSGMNAELVVRGYDRLHRLYREPKCKAFLNAKDSDLAASIARAAGMQADIEETTIVYPHLLQENVSDLAFLQRRAQRIGFECFVAADKLVFRRPKRNGANATLTWGRDLVSFLPRMTVAEQVDEVVVKGWDVQTQRAIVGRAAKGALYPEIGEARDGAAWGQQFGGGRAVIVDQPVVSQAEADLLAAAQLDVCSGAFVEADGEAYRRPDLCAGHTVELRGLGKRLSGKYLITRATHLYTATGLTTHFAVHGLRNGMLSDVIPGVQHAIRWPGVAPAIVTNTDDPEAWGRVKLKYPWLAEEVESDWARVAGTGAGPEAGFFAIPEVGDEVLVAFVHGHFGHATVIGSLWNGQHPIPPEAASAGTGELPRVRTWRARSGHRITLDDRQAHIDVISAQGHRITLDDDGRTITIASRNGHTITLNDEEKRIEITSTGTLTIDSRQDLKLTSDGNIDIRAEGDVRIRGQRIELN
jgi:phage protein D/phage gp45-like